MVAVSKSGPCSVIYRPPAASVSGSGGHNATFAVACIAASMFRLDEAGIMEILREYHERCQPPWTERELLHKAQDAGVPQSPLETDCPAPARPEPRPAGVPRGTFRPRCAFCFCLARRVERATVRGATDCARVSKGVS
jgi:hypothetical protein